jgi:enediyne polyketide synthase
VAGRLGVLPTLAWGAAPLPLLRFLETPRVHVPGVELVVDSQLSASRDPYLEDHVFRGERILPAVMVMEAMAQAAMALGGWNRAPGFEDLVFLQPIVAPAAGSLTLRVAALATAPDRIELVVRSSATDFQTEHARARCRAPEATPARHSPGVGANGGAVAVPQDGSGGSARALEPGRSLYGSVLFQAGRFHRLAGYQQLSATECDARLTSDGEAAWFGDYLPAHLVLGDPGARDAALHAIQACVPHRTLLPVAVARVQCVVLDPLASYVAHAIERARSADSFVFDLSIRDADGAEVERWDGLRLAAVRGEPSSVPQAPALLGTYLERRLGDLIPGAGLRVALENGGGAREARSEVATRELLGNGARPERRPDGRRVLASGAGFSVAHAELLTLAVTAPDAAACDVQRVEARDPVTWAGLLGATYGPLAVQLASHSGEASASAATRAWCAVECLKKQGLSADAPLAIESLHEDGWVVFSSGRHAIATFVAHDTPGRPGLVLAVLGVRGMSA